MHPCLLILLFLIIPVLLWLVCRLLTLKSSIAQAARELEEISAMPAENRAVKLSVPSRDLEVLFAAVNHTLESIRQERCSYQAREEQLKDQIENISHDLRTPLTVILGYLKLIDTGHLTAEESSWLDTAIRKSETMQSLITQFYELSCVTSGSLHPELTVLDGARLLKETCLENYLLFEDAHPALNLSVPDTPVCVFANADALKRIFTNLLQNAARYAQSTLNLQAFPGDDGKTAVFCFSNDITPTQRLTDPSRLFDRFYMQEASRKSGGSGLGLTISRELALLMGGTIEAAYFEENETCFLKLTVSLPLAAAPEPRPGNTPS